MIVRQRNTGLICMILLAVALAAAVVCYLFRDLLPLDSLLPMGRETFQSGTSLNGVDVSGLTVREAERTLKQAAEEYTLTVTFADGEKNFTARELGLTVAGRSEIREQLHTQGAQTDTHLFRCPVEQVEERVSGLPELTSRTGKVTRDAGLKLNREKARFELRASRVGGTIRASDLARAMSRTAEQLQPELNALTTGLYDGRIIRVRTDESLQRALKSAERLLDQTITCHFTLTQAGIDQRVELDRHQIAQWLRVEEDGTTVSIRGKRLRQYVRELSRQYTGTLEGPAQFRTALGTYVEVDAPGSGIKVDQDAFYQKLKAAIYSGKGGECKVPYQEGSGTADLGGTYVEVDLEHQHLYLYQDGKRTAEGDICSGSVVDGNSTPEGLYTINDIDHDRYLRGASYREWVNCFMPYDGGYGLHDSTWREQKDYGGDVYLQNGSHGCINMPLELVETLDRAIGIGTPVILYGSGTAKKDWNGQAILGASSYVRNKADGAFSLSAYADGGGTLSYRCSDNDVVTVNENGEVTPVGTGKATITVRAEATEEKGTGEKQIVVLITDSE